MTAVLTDISKEWNQEQHMGFVYVFCCLGMYFVESFFLLPVILATVRPRVLILKYEGKRYSYECHKKNSWSKGKRRKTRNFTVCT